MLRKGQSLSGALATRHVIVSMIFLYRKLTNLNVMMLQEVIITILKEQKCSRVLNVCCGRDTFWGQTYHALLIPPSLQISIQDPANLSIEVTDNGNR